MFILSVFITIFQFIFSAVNAKYIFEYPLFQRVRNILFSDFYHVNDMVFENSPYFEDQSSYPPFVLFLAKFFALFGDYSKGYGTVVTQPLGVVAVVIYYGLFFASFCFLTYYLFKKDSWKNWHIAIVLVCFFISAPFCSICTANECLIVCGVNSLSILACSLYCFNIFQKPCLVIF